MPLDLTSPSVSGPFYFAWIDAGETFDPFVHAREDEKIFSLEFNQAEGDFGTLTIEIRNPRIGLLTAARKRRCFLSYASQAASPGDVRHLFTGRLVGIPDDINGEIITLVFTGRPDNFALQKIALAATMKTRPYFDPVWISFENQVNPDTVLEARTELWHINRVTGLVTTSDLLVGEDGTQVFQASEVPYDSVQVHLQQTPLRRVHVVANVGWQQSDSGDITFLTNKRFDSFLADSVAKDWPKVGASLGGGWTVKSSQASSSIDNIPSDAFHTTINIQAPPNPFEDHGGVIEPPQPPPRNTIGRPIPHGWIFVLDHWERHGTSTSTESTLQVQENGYIIPFVSIWLSMDVHYEAQRNRKEQVNFTVEADTQPILTDTGDDDTLQLTFSGNDLGKINGAGLEIAIGDVRRRHFFPTARGLLSLEYLFLIARAHLILRARAVEVTFECSFDRAIDLSCRMNAQIHDDRLPGGVATGKIIKYGFSCNGDSGQTIGSVTIGCAVGYGNAVVGSVGDPSYVDLGYVDSGYQFYTNQVNLLPAGDIGYTVPGTHTVDDGLQFPLYSIPFQDEPRFFPVSLGSVHWPADFERDPSESMDAAAAILKTARCHFDFTPKPVNGSTFSDAFVILCTTLQVPKQIDLEAASS